MDVYKSKNSGYYFDENHLIRTRKKDGKKTRIEGEIFYISQRPLEKLLRKYDVSVKPGKRIDSFKAKKLIKAIKETKGVLKDKTELGGRFFALSEVGEEYSTFYTGKIDWIEQEEEKKTSEKLDFVLKKEDENPL